jgi:cytoskeletal protein RodZ
MDFSVLKQQPAPPKKGRWLLIGSIVAVLGVVGVILWQRRKDKKAKEEEEKRLKEANANQSTTAEVNPKSSPVVTTTPVATTTTSTSGNTPKDVANNLGGGYDAKNDRTNVTYDGKKYQATFYNNNRFFIFRTSDNAWIKKGSYSNGGKTLVVDGGKTFTSNSVWTNLQNAVK